MWRALTQVDSGHWSRRGQVLTHHLWKEWPRLPWAPWSISLCSVSLQGLTFWRSLQNVLDALSLFHVGSSLSIKCTLFLYQITWHTTQSTIVPPAVHERDGDASHTKYKIHKLTDTFALANKTPYFTRPEQWKRQRQRQRQRQRDKQNPLTQMFFLFFLFLIQCLCTLFHLLYWPTCSTSAFFRRKKCQREKKQETSEKSKHTFCPDELAGSIVPES